MHARSATRSVLLLSTAWTLAPGTATASWGERSWGEMIWGSTAAVPGLPAGPWLLAAFLGGAALASLLADRRRAASLLALLAALAPVVPYAEPIEYPHKFQNGTIADADEVNENFDAASMAHDAFTSRFGPRFPSQTSPPLPTVGGHCSSRVIGEVWQFAGIFPPEGTVFAHGQILQIADYSSLFSLIGTIYGGDGRTEFAVPDLRGLETEGVNYVICALGTFPLQN